jgi:protein TonB
MFENLRNTWNLDEEVFENRNRDYGAYQLRRRYNSVVTASIIIAVLIFAGVILIPFLMRPRDEKVLAGSSYGIPVSMEHFEVPEDIYVPPAAPPPPPKAQEIMKYVPPVLVDSVVPVNSLLPTPEELSDMPQTDDMSELAGTGTGDNVFGVEGGIPTDQPYFVVETMPSFRGGGLDKFREWVIKRTNYPQEAINKKIRGQVLLTFIVETDGSVSTVTVVRGIDPLIDSEAVKAIESSPKWTPGFQHGHPVRVRYSIPLNFTLP